jgi:hypothetical protein
MKTLLTLCPDFPDRTIRYHCTNLRLLGGEIIRNFGPHERHPLRPSDWILGKIGPDGGPYCHHLDSPAELDSFDATCRALYLFLTASTGPQPSKSIKQPDARAGTAGPRKPEPARAASRTGPQSGREWTIMESDWKHLKKVWPAALERLCARALEKVGRAAASSDGTAHQRYQKVWTLLRAHDKEVDLAFDDLKRSTALAHLTAMRHLDSVTEEEFAAFSEDLRHKVGLILSSWK